MRDKLIDDVINYKLDAAFVPAPLNHSELEPHYIKKKISKLSLLKTVRVWTAW